MEIKENAIKKSFGNRFAIFLDFDFFKHPVYLYGLKEDLIVRLEMNSCIKVIVCIENTVDTYKLSNISLEYDAIFEEFYTTISGEFSGGTILTSCTKVSFFHYQTLSKKYATWKIDINNMPVR